MSEQAFHDTKDLFEAAFLMTCGREPEDVICREGTSPNGHPQVLFRFHLQETKSLVEQFRRGKARANVSVLRCFLEYLKDRLFETIRAHKTNNS